jgi:Putative zinc-finger
MAQRNPSRRIRSQQDAMTCQRVTAMVQDYLAGELASEIAAALEEHLHDCPDCTTFINTYKRTTQAPQSIRYEDIPAEMQSRVRQFLRAKIKQFPPTADPPAHVKPPCCSGLSPPPQGVSFHSCYSVTVHLFKRARRQDARSR